MGYVIHIAPDFSITSHYNGAAFTLSRGIGPSRRTILLQGDDASQFNDAFEAARTCDQIDNLIEDYFS